MYMKVICYLLFYCTKGKLNTQLNEVSTKLITKEKELMELKVKMTENIVNIIPQVNLIVCSYLLNYLMYLLSRN